MIIEFTDLAEAELADAIEYYELQLHGLGKKFLDEVFESIELIKLFPRS